MVRNEFLAIVFVALSLVLTLASWAQFPMVLNNEHVKPGISILLYNLIRDVTRSHKVVQTKFAIQTKMFIKQKTNNFKKPNRIPDVINDHKQYLS